MDVPVLGIIENMSYLEMPDGTQVDVFGRGGGEELAQESGVPLIGTIPLEPSVREGGDKGVPIVISDPDSKVAKALINLTEDLAAKISVQALTGKGKLEIEMLD
jgi:ATP-binding protein involved in chromosome partitioning